MIEHQLRERLSLRLRAKIRGETEGLADGQVSLDREQRCSRALLLAEDLASTPVEHGVDTADGVFRALDFHWVKIVVKDVSRSL